MALFGMCDPFRFVSYVFFSVFRFSYAVYFFTGTAFWQVMALTGKPFEHLELPQVGGRNGWFDAFFVFVSFLSCLRRLLAFCVRLIFVPTAVLYFFNYIYIYIFNFITGTWYIIST